MAPIMIRQFPSHVWTFLSEVLALDFNYATDTIRLFPISQLLSKLQPYIIITGRLNSPYR